MRVEDLSTYGKAFDHFPLKAKIVQTRVMFFALCQNFGFIKTFGFLGRVSKEQKKLKAEYLDIINNKFPNLPESAVTELFMMAAMYNVLSEIYDKEAAYNFLQLVIRKVGPTVHSIFYDIDNLKKCEGDIFINFCKINRSLFENSAASGYYEIEIKESENLQHVCVTKCLNVDAFISIGCPELGRIGCDFDIGGYAPEALGDQVNLDFRRPKTIADGDKQCNFYYYRKGHAPEDMETK